MKYSIVFAGIVATAYGLATQSQFAFNPEQPLLDQLVSPPVDGWNVVTPFEGDVAGYSGDFNVMAADGLAPEKNYTGGFTDATEIRLRIGNGGAGQSGLVGALADEFIKWMVNSNVGWKPFKVRFYLQIILMRY